jgi:hypothetical protein
MLLLYPPPSPVCTERPELARKTMTLCDKINGALDSDSVELGRRCLSLGPCKNMSCKMVDTVFVEMVSKDKFMTHTGHSWVTVCGNRLVCAIK